MALPHPVPFLNEIVDVKEQCQQAQTLEAIAAVALPRLTQSLVSSQNTFQVAGSFYSPEGMRTLDMGSGS